MAGIGNYIHLTATGYLEHGVSENEKSKNYQSQIKNIKKRAVVNTKSLKSFDKKEFEDLLNSMLNSKSDDKYVKMAQKIIEVKLKEKFQETCGKIDFNTGDVLFEEEMVESKIPQQKDSFDFSMIIDKVNELEEILINSIKDGIEGAEEGQKQLENLKTKYNQAYIIFEKELKERGIEDISSISSGKKSNISKETDLGKLREELNNLIKAWAAIPAISAQKGFVFENLIRMAPMVAKKTAAIELGNVIGHEVEDVSLNLKNFDNKLLTQNFKTTEVKTRTSQGKVDVQINWNGSNLKISAKNVNLKHRYVTLVSNSSLLYMIQDENPNYVNHILNILASHSTKNVKGKEAKEKESASINTIKGMTTRVRNELKLLLFYKALTGDLNKRKKANLFIVNDLSGKGVRIFTVSELIDSVASNPNSNKLSITAVNSEMTPFLNKGGDGISKAARISALLSDVHARKITVKISSEILK